DLQCVGGDLGVQARQNAIKELQDRYLRTQTIPDRRELQANVAAANHHEPLGRLLVTERFGARTDAVAVEFNAAKRRRLTACGDDDVLSAQLDRFLFRLDHDLAAPGDASGATVAGDLILLEETVDAFGQTADHL